MTFYYFKLIWQHLGLLITLWCYAEQLWWPTAKFICDMRMWLIVYFLPLFFLCLSFVPSNAQVRHFSWSKDVFSALRRTKDTKRSQKDRKKAINLSISVSSVGVEQLIVSVSTQRVGRADKQSSICCARAPSCQPTSDGIARGEPNRAERDRLDQLKTDKRRQIFRYSTD